jgi:hypothetical protein
VIPAILAAPVAEGVLGSVAGSVAGVVSGLFGGNPAAPVNNANASSSSFGPILNQVAARATASLYSQPSGSMTSMDWSQMGGTDLHTWLMSLTGRHVNAVDTSGRTVSGIVQGFSTMNGTMGLNIGGHFVSLSHLNQVSWSPAVR